VIRAWVAGAEGVRLTDPGEAVRTAATGGTVWVDLDCEDEASARALLEPLHIHPLILEDMVSEVNRPKVDDYGTYLYLVVHSARWDQDRPHLREVDIVLGERFLITYHDGSTRSIAAAHEVLARRPELLAQGPAKLLHFVLDVLVDHYLPIMDQVSDEIDALEEKLFDERRPLAHSRVLRLKRGMSAMRRIVGPQRDTVLALTRDEYRAIPADMRPYLRDVYDRLARVNDLLDSFRDEVASLLDLQVSMTSNRLNEVIKRLTVIATIGLPLTIVTSYYGMNFEFAEYHWRHGTIYVLALLAATALVTWWWIRRKRWL
jgi:magnesium transporter